MEYTDDFTLSDAELIHCLEALEQRQQQQQQEETEASDEAPNIDISNSKVVLPLSTSSSTAKRTIYEELVGRRNRADVLKPRPALEFPGQIAYITTASDCDLYVKELWKRLKPEKPSKPTNSVKLDDGMLLDDSTNPCPTLDVPNHSTSCAYVLGFDVEWRVTFQSGVAPRPVALLQLCYDDLCCLFHIVHFSMTDALKTLLADRTVLKVGVNSVQDGNRLKQDYKIPVEGTVELSLIANEHTGDNRKWSLNALSEHFLKKSIPKMQQDRCSNWEKKPLSLAQRHYAALDAFAGWKLYKHFESLPALENNVSSQLQRTLANHSGDAKNSAITAPIASSDNAGTIDFVDELAPTRSLPTSKWLCYRLFHLEAKSIDTIAALRKIKPMTVETYLHDAMRAGYAYFWSRFRIPKDVYGSIYEQAAAFESTNESIDNGDQNIPPSESDPYYSSQLLSFVKSKLPEGVTYNQIKLCLIHRGRLKLAAKKVTVPPVIVQPFEPMKLEDVIGDPI